MSYDSVTHREILRGDIFWVYNNVNSTGFEMRKTRPAVIIGTSQMDRSLVNIVWLSASCYDSPTNIDVKTAIEESKAVCGQITTVSTERLGTFIGKCAKDEFDNIMAAINEVLGTSITPCDNSEDEALLAKAAATAAVAARLLEDNQKLEAKLELMRELYNNLLAEKTN